MLARGNANQLLLSRRTSTPATTYARTQRAVRRLHTAHKHSWVLGAVRWAHEGHAVARERGRRAHQEFHWDLARTHRAG